MNWDAIGALGELLGSTVVLVTLIAIWSQMRQSAKMERAAAWLFLTALGGMFGLKRWKRGSQPVAVV